MKVVILAGGLGTRIPEYSSKIPKPMVMIGRNPIIWHIMNHYNHFGFEDVKVTEQAQFTEYPEGGFYDWHMDSDTNMAHEPPVRKISMTLLLNDPSEFEGGHLELMAPGKYAELKQGHAICFASFLNHRVNKVTRGVRQSLVVWFGGKPFK